ncbi:MAG TPA: hypothetical protein VFG50_16820, partial [Rhodothermales bacterium]|nr:hypothetical protein [Rhodothermales bacterium]
RADLLAEGLVRSVTLGVGQFCTNPGLIIVQDCPASGRFIERLADGIREAPCGAMLYPGIQQAFEEGIARMRAFPGVTVLAQSPLKEGAASGVLLQVDAPTFLTHPELQNEVFGPSSLVVTAGDGAGLEAVASALEGQLTATIHATEEDLIRHRRLVGILQRRVGRLIFNGYPTGVEVGPAMQHGGPYPATTDARTTSVGTAAVFRFARPVCYQDFPQQALPPELRDGNERGIWRLVDGALTREDVTVR